MAIRFWQQFGKEIRVIDHWAGNNTSIVDTINNVIKKRAYNYGKHYAPHDVKVKDQ